MPVNDQIEEGEAEAAPEPGEEEAEGKGEEDAEEDDREDWGGEAASDGRKCECVR